MQFKNTEEKYHLEIQLKMQLQATKYNIFFQQHVPITVYITLSVFHSYYTTAFGKHTLRLHKT